MPNIQQVRYPGMGTIAPWRQALGAGLEGISQQVGAHYDRREADKKAAELFRNVLVNKGWSSGGNINVGGQTYRPPLPEPPDIKMPFTEGQIQKALGELDSGSFATFAGRYRPIRTREQALIHIGNRLGIYWRDISPKAAEIIDKKWPETPAGKLFNPKKASSVPKPAKKTFQQTPSQGEEDDSFEAAINILVEKGWNRAKAEEYLINAVGGQLGGNL